MPGATLLSLPREIRDQILNLCLTTELPPPPLGQIYTLQPLSFSEVLTSSTQKKTLGDFNFPVAPRTNSGGLLLTSRQISAETRDALERLNEHGKLDYIMQLRIEEEEGDVVGSRERYLVDWMVLPTKSWLPTSRAVKNAAVNRKQTQKIAAVNAQPTVNLVIEIEKTMRAKPAGPLESQSQSQSQGDFFLAGQQQHHHQPPHGQHIFGLPPTPTSMPTALHRRYHFLCSPEHRQLPPPALPAPRSLLVAADHGVLLLHWTLGDLIARIVEQGPLFFESATTRPRSFSFLTSSSSPSSSSSSQQQQQPVPFNLVLRNRHFSSSLPPSSSSAATAAAQNLSSSTQPLETPLLEFLPFYLHSAKLTHTLFGTLISRGLLRGFKLETRQCRRCPSSSGTLSATAAIDSSTISRSHHHRRRGADASQMQRPWRLPQEQAACPVPERSEEVFCCGKATRIKADEAVHPDVGLHWVCNVIRDVKDAEDGIVTGGSGVEGDYDDDWQTGEEG